MEFCCCFVWWFCIFEKLTVDCCSDVTGIHCLMCVIGEKILVVSNISEDCKVLLVMH